MINTTRSGWFFLYKLQEQYKLTPNNSNCTNPFSNKIMMQIKIATYYDEIATSQNEIQSLKTELTNARAEANSANHELEVKNIINELLTKENNDLKDELANLKENGTLARNEMLQATLLDREKELAKKTTQNEILREVNKKLALLKASVKQPVTLANFPTQNEALTQQNNSLKLELENSMKENAEMALMNTKLNDELKQLSDKCINQTDRIHIFSCMILNMVFDDDDGNIGDCIENIIYYMCDNVATDDMVYEDLELGLDTNFFGINHLSLVAWVEALYDKACSLKFL